MNARPTSHRFWSHGFRPRLAGAVRRGAIGLGVAAAVVALSPGWPASTFAQDLPAPRLLEEIPRRIDIRFDNQRVSELPDGINEVWVGPSGRVWYGRAIDARTSVAIDQVMKFVEDEWDQPHPQVIGAKIALIEPDRVDNGRTVRGRVWFNYSLWAPGAVRLRNALLGYDGQTWVVRDADVEKDASFHGDMSQTGGTSSVGNNVYADGKAFFVSQGDVHVYDGSTGEWTVKVLWPRQESGGTSGASLFVEPGGSVVVATTRGRGASAVHRYHQGTWTPLNLPRAGRRTTWVDDIAFRGNQGVWAMANDRRPIYLPFEGVDQTDIGQVAVEVPPELLADLENVDYRRRDEASGRLIALGEPALPALRAHRAASLSPEGRRRLERVIETLETNIAVRNGDKTAPHGSTLWFGPIEYASAKFIRQDPLGRVFVGAIEVRGKGLFFPSALLVYDPSRPAASRYGLVVEPDVTELWDRGNVYARSHAHWKPTPDGSAFWVPGDSKLKLPATLVDFVSGRVIARAPDESFESVYEVLPDGTLVTGGPGRFRLFRHWVAP